MNVRIRKKIVKRIIAPILNAIFLYFLYVLVQYHMLPMTAVIGFVPVIIAAYVAGTRAGLASAIMFIVFAYGIIGDFDLWRFLTLAIVSLVTAGLLGYARRQEWAAEKALLESLRREKALRLQAEHNQEARNFVEGLNGNMALLNDVVESINLLLRDWDKLPASSLKERLRNERHRLVNLQTSVEGWVKLAWIKEIIMAGVEGGKKDD